MLLNEYRALGRPAQTMEDWKAVRAYCDTHTKLRPENYANIMSPACVRLLEGDIFALGERLAVYARYKQHMQQLTDDDAKRLASAFNRGAPPPLGEIAYQPGYEPDYSGLLLSSPFFFDS